MFFNLKKRWQRLLCALLFALPMPVAAQQADAFVIEDIRIEGLQRISPGVIFNLMPVGIGDEFQPAQSAALITALYNTGHFREVDVLRDGGVLVIKVEENPTIVEVTISGLEELSEDRVLEMLNSAGIAESKIFNQSVVEEARRAIENVYVERNYYHVEVETVVSPLSRNRVAILFNVDEGDEAYIRSVQIIGNEAFSTWRLRQDMRMKPRGLLNYFSESHRYSDDKLEADLARIRTRYLEAGYLRFEVESSQVEVSSDKKAIDIILRLKEGEPYTVSGTRFVGAAGELPFDDEELEPYIKQQPGEVYSGVSAAETVNEVRAHLDDLGYANAQVQQDIDINDDDNTAENIYIINPRKVVYVRRINISGNEVTADEIIRRELLQFETERYSQSKIDSSRSRLRRLGYFSNVVIDTLPVAGSTEMVDLLVRVQEANTGQVRIGGGFGSEGGLTYNLSFSNSNVFGTGNDFSASFSKDEDNENYSFSLNEHYYTKEGVTRHISGSFGEAQAGEKTAVYSYNTYRGAYGFRFPYADDGTYHVHLVYESITVSIVDAGAYPGFTSGDEFENLVLDSAFTYDDRDTSNVPTEGQYIYVGAEFGTPFMDLQYYRLSYSHDYYTHDHGLSKEMVMHLRLGAGFGDSYGGGDYPYPFYKRFHVGGVGTLRGFTSGSIGYVTRGDRAVGGKSNLYTSAEITIPVKFFETQQIFLVPFTDIAGVGEEINPKDFRASAGLELRWISPVGPLRFSYSWPLAEETNDSVQNFQFAISSF